MLFHKLKRNESPKKGRLSEDFTEHFPHFFIHVLGVRSARVTHNNESKTCLVFPNTVKGRDFLTYADLDFAVICRDHIGNDVLPLHKSILVLKNKNIHKQFENWLRSLNNDQLRFLDWCDDLWIRLFEQAQTVSKDFEKANVLNDPHSLVDKYVEMIVFNVIWSLATENIVEVSSLKKAAQMLKTHCRIDQKFMDNLGNLNPKQETELCILEMQSLEAIALSTYPAKQKQKEKLNATLENKISKVLQSIDSALRKKLKNGNYDLEQISRIELGIQHDSHIHKIKHEDNDMERNMKKTDSGRESLQKMLINQIRNYPYIVSFKYCEEHDHFLFHVGQTLGDQETIRIDGNSNIRLIETSANKSSISAALNLLYPQ